MAAPVVLTVTDEYPQALIVVDHEGKLLMFSKAFTKLTGWVEADLLAANFVALHCMPNCNNTGTTWQIQIETSSGTTVCLNANCSNTVTADGAKVTVIFFEKVTVDNSLLEQNKNLQIRLEALSKEMEHFAYITSHDLQAPLRMVASYMQLIQKSLNKGELERAKEFMEYVQDGVTNLHSLIDGLLYYSRVTRKGAVFTDIDMNEALTAAIAQLTSKIESSGAKLSSGKLPLMRGDSNQLRQLFLNLIDNAIKFSYSEKQPLIAVSVVEQEDSFEFVVTDNGIGVEPKYHERIFQMFQRLHSRNEYEGTGAGLAICNKIVEQHGGRMWVSSDKGSGAAFHFTLKKHL